MWVFIVNECFNWRKLKWIKLFEWPSFSPFSLSFFLFTTYCHEPNRTKCTFTSETIKRQAIFFFYLRICIFYIACFIFIFIFWLNFVNEQHLLTSFVDLQKNPVEGFSAGLVGDNIYEVNQKEINIIHDVIVHLAYLFQYHIVGDSYYRCSRYIIVTLIWQIDIYAAFTYCLI